MSDGDDDYLGHEDAYQRERAAADAARNDAINWGLMADAESDPVVEDIERQGAQADWDESEQHAATADAERSAASEAWGTAMDEPLDLSPDPADASDPGGG